MRTEAIINEAKDFKRDMSAYIHMEMLDGKKGTAVITGDDPAIVLCIYSIIEGFARMCVPDDAPVKDILARIKTCLYAMNRLYKISKKNRQTMFDRIVLDKGDDDE